MKNNSYAPKAQSGFMLLEALLAILIFSLGILALVALQAKSIQLSGDAKYRTNATLLANKLIGEMWVSGLSVADLKTAFETDGDSYKDWRDNHVANFENGDGLPGIEAAASGVTSTEPTVVIGADGAVTITLHWRTPEMKRDADHQHIVVSQIVRNAP